MNDSLHHAAYLTRGGKYINIRIPVKELPRTMQAQPARMNIRVIPPGKLPAIPALGAPTYVLALKADKAAMVPSPLVGEGQGEGSLQIEPPSKIP